MLWSGLIQALRAPAKIKRPWLLLFFLLIIPFVYGLYMIQKQALFENFLNSSYITFDDFQPKFSEALKASVQNGQPLQYYNYSSFSALDPASKIPPTIHFIWFKDLYETHPGHTKIPSMGSEAPEYCREYNPEFTINIWNATGARHLLEQNYSWFLPTYDGYKHPIQRVDAFKYFVLWHYGGIYIDLDISCRRTLAPLLEFPAWFPRASPLGVNNDIMATRSGHPILEKMTKSLEPRDKNLLFPYVTVFWTTGPQFTSDVLKMWVHEHPETKHIDGESKKQADPDDFYILPQEFYSEEYTFFGHSPGGTWHGQDVAVVLWLVDRQWIIWLAVSIIVVLCLAIVQRRRRKR